MTLVGTGVSIRLSSSGDLATLDLVRVPLLAVLTCLFVGYATWRNRAERLVVRDRERLARLIDALPLATIAFDGDARVVTWNRTAESLFGWKAEDVFGKPNPIVPPDEKPGSDELHGRILRGEMLKDVEVRRRAADGSVLELSVFTSLLDGELGPQGGFLVVYDDITERKGAERARDEAQDSYRDLIEALPLVSYVDRIDGATTTNVYTSPQIVELLGWDLAAWTVDRHFFEELLHADDFERVMGGTVDANANGGEHAHEYRLRHANGDYVWVRDQSTIVENDAGTFVRGFLLDITKQKQLEEQLLQTQKMDALGQFAGGIAHDFNNLLTAISGYAELASASAHTDGAQTRWLEGIKTAAAEAASLTSQPPLLQAPQRDRAAPGRSERRRPCSGRPARPARARGRGGAARTGRDAPARPGRSRPAEAGRAEPGAERARCDGRAAARSRFRRPRSASPSSCASATPAAG